MLHDLRADAVRRELVALGAAGLGVDELQAAAAEVVRRAVPYDATCWATVDPDTAVLTGSVTLHFDPGPALEARFAEVEASGSDVNSYRELVRNGAPVARLSDAGRHVVRASPRLAEIYEPLGFAHELRAAFAIDGSCWGVAGLLREGDAADFSDDEVAFLASVAPVIAAGIRRALLVMPVAGSPPPGTAVLIADEHGNAIAATPEAERLLSNRDAAGGPSLRLAVRSVIAAVRLQQVDHATARLRDRRGAWLSIVAAPLRAGDRAGQVAVTIDATPAADLTGLLLRAHGLSAREQDVCREVLAGRSTADIAEALFISPNTVQDHLKSIFDKTGVRSRRELAARLRSR